MNGHARKWLALAMPLWLTACAVGPDYREPALAPIKLHSAQATQLSAEQKADDAQDWWVFFDDPVLTRHMQAALEHNHDIRQAGAKLLAARAAFDERQSDRLPDARVQAGYQRGRQQQMGAQDDVVRSSSHSYRLGVDVQWEIDLFGRLARLSESARATAQASEAHWRQIRQSIAAEVAYAYFESIGLQRQLAQAEAETASWQETAALTQAKVEAGNGLMDELENARSQWQSSQATIPPLQAALQQARYRLDVLLGERPGTTLSASEQLPSLPLVRQLPLGDVNMQIRQRPDVRHAERLLAASTADVGAATADLYPRLNLAGFLGFFALRGADLGSAARAFELAPSASWPALRFGGVRARLRGAEAIEQGALAAYEQTVLRAQEEVENAVVALVEHQRRVQSLVRAAAHAQSALDIAQARYQAGAGAYQNVLENQRSLFALKKEVAVAETSSYVNVVTLYKALGWGMQTSEDY